ncbi:lamin tail domain-containing protein [Halegenticoccus tardaugens]|uniref:lamin tail domain-containing protein n=1 Tax=Halegenticoccus tardaugens TaxID=2071624 RepID=UPI001E3ABBAF|nr:lamin tail domain-containing protein [Halegenticoccus tardaugens]
MIGAGAAALGIAGLGAGSTVIASDHSGLAFAEVNAEDEYVVIENTGDEGFDLSGYWMEFEHGQNVSQAREFPDGAVVEAGETLTVASGAEDVDDADVTFDYDRGVINNDGSDTMAILEPDEETVVVTSDESTSDESGEGDDGESGDEETDDRNVEEENTITITVVDEETGDPIEGAEVTGVIHLPGPAEDYFEIETNSEGVAETTSPAVYHEIEVSADGYYDGNATADLEEGDKSVTVELQPESDDGDDEESDETDSSDETDDTGSEGSGDGDETDEDDGTEEENAADEDC